MSIWRKNRGASDMMSCAELAKVLQAHLDRELDEVTARRAAGHLEACRRCGLEAETYSQIKSALAITMPPERIEAVERAHDFAASLIADKKGPA